MVAAGVAFAFIAYGSWIPFTRNQTNLGEALRHFELIREAGLIIGSRVDFGSNVLLMLPAAFCLFGSLWVPGRHGLNAFSAALVLAGCAGWAHVVEFGQLFFSARTPSYSDIVAQTLGAGLGIGLWWCCGGELWRRYFQSAERQPADRWVRGLIVYLAAMALYQLTPLDISVNPHDIYDKWQAGRISILPTLDPGATGIASLYELAADIAVWVPLGFLLARMGNRRVGELMARAVFVVGSIEFAQILVFSRHSALSDLLLGACGAFLGILLARRAHAEPVHRRGESADSGALGEFAIGVVLFLGYLLLLAIMFWYPYDVFLDRAFVQQRIEGFFAVPLENFFHSTILTATAGLFRKLVLFMPLGLGLGWCARAALMYLPRFAIRALVVGAACTAAAVIEIGQIFLVSKVAVVTDAAIMAIGGLVGYALCKRYLLSMR